MNKAEILIRLKDNAVLFQIRSADIAKQIEDNQLPEAFEWLVRTRNEVLNKMIDDINLYME